MNADGRSRASAVQAVEVAALSDTGLKREHNEDSFLMWDIGRSAMVREPSVIAITDDGALLAVCDGMGGAVAGELASALSVQALAERAASLTRDDLAEPVGLTEWMVGGACEANRRTLRRMEEDPELQGMGSTLTSIVVTSSHVAVAHVGDSRAYHLRDGVLRRITIDQSFVGRLVALGRITEEQARHHEQKNLLLQAIGSEQEPEVDRVVFPALPGDRLLICSDGLSDLVEDREILEVLQRPGPISDGCRALVDLANARGGVDNITVVIGALS